MERSLRIAVLAFRRWTARLGISRCDAAYRLALSLQTLAAWKRDWISQRRG